MYKFQLVDVGGCWWYLPVCPCVLYPCNANESFSQSLLGTKEQKVMKCWLCMLKKTTGILVAAGRGERGRSDTQEPSVVPVITWF